MAELLSKELKEYTDLSCPTAETAQAVLQYLLNEIAQEEEPPGVEAYVEKATVRITYTNCRERYAWDMQAMGYRDGLDDFRLRAIEAVRAFVVYHLATCPNKPCDCTGAWFESLATRLESLSATADKEVGHE